MMNLSFYPGDEEEQDQKSAGLSDEADSIDGDLDEPSIASTEEDDDLLDDGIVEGEEIE